MDILEFSKGYNSGTPWASLKKCVKYIYTSNGLCGIVFIYYDLDDLNTVEGVWDKTFHQQT